MEIVNIIHRIKSLPLVTKRYLGLGVVIALFIALPVFIWALVTQQLFFSKKAASGEPGVCLAFNKIITVTPITDTIGTCHDIQTAVNAVNGPDFKIEIHPGIYNATGTIDVTGKSNITITGVPQMGNNSAVINFVPNGWGFLVENSSGAIEWLTIGGGSSNGMISVKNSSDFRLGYLKVDSQTSHTVDVQRSTNVNIYNSEITSSAGALEIQNSTNTTISNNRIYNSDHGVTVYNSAGTTIIGNLVTANREGGLYVNNITNTNINHNTFNNNSTNSSNPNVSLNGAVSLLNFSNNLVVNSPNSGISFNGTTFTRTFGHNDVWNNLGGNYVGFDDYTGVNGNISLDPLITYNQNLAWCLNPESPAIYGNPNNYDVIGSLPVCSALPRPSPSPSPTPTATCLPRPPCLDSIPRCLMPEPVDGWCPNPTPSPTPIPGDVNGDGHVNIIDIGIIIDNYRSSPITDARADLNHDGIVNIVDIGIIVDNYEF